MPSSRAESIAERPRRTTAKRSICRFLLGAIEPAAKLARIVVLHARERLQQWQERDQSGWNATPAAQ